MSINSQLLQKCTNLDQVETHVDDVLVGVVDIDPRPVMVAVVVGRNGIGRFEVEAVDYGSIGYIAVKQKEIILL